MSRALPPLELRTTRVRLLAATYDDALTSCAAGGRADSHGSRLNLHDSLWTLGSYAELDRALSSMNGRRRSFSRLYLDVPFKAQPNSVDDGLQLVANLMPRNIFVPVLVALNAGYLEGQASAYGMPEREARRRFDRRRA